MHGGAEGPLADLSPATIRDMIAAQHCAWCGRQELRSLANHTVLVHGIRAAELRRLAGLSRDAPLCSSALSERHRELAVEQDAVESMRRPEVYRAAAATREANYDLEQRKRRLQHLTAVRGAAVEAARRAKDEERADPVRAAARFLARSKARRVARDGVECGICGAWFCSVAEPGKDYRQRKFCSADCRSEAQRRLRLSSWRRRALEDLRSAGS